MLELEKTGPELEVETDLSSKVPVIKIRVLCNYENSEILEGPSYHGGVSSSNPLTPTLSKGTPVGLIYKENE